MIKDQLTFSEHEASASRLCCFALYNIRKIRPYLSEYVTLGQALAISRLDCNAHTGGPEGHIIQLFINLHWIPLVAHIQFKSLMLPSYLR